MAPPPSLPVASRLRGVWRRTLLTMPAAGDAPALRDDTSAVFWLQTDTLFGDLRLPAALAAPGAPREAFGAQISFAGHTTTANDLCSWHRELDFGSPFLPGFDFAPPGGDPDTARLTWLSEDVLHEDDTDGALYHEEWARVPESAGDCYAFRLAAAGGNGASPPREAVLLCAGDCFMFVAAASTPGAELEDRLSYEASYGRVRRGASDAEPCWRITHSTVPGRAGATLLPAHVGPGAEEIEAEAARGGGALRGLGAFAPEAGWECARAWPGAALPEIDLAALDWRANAALRAAEVAKLRGALLTESGSGAFSAKTSAFVPPELVLRAYAHNRAFHALPEADKQPLHFARYADGRGWVPLHAEGAYEAGAVASHVTTFDMGRNLAPDHPLVAAGVRGAAPNVYPADTLVPGFEADMQALDRGLAQCAAILFRGFAAALGLADEAAFAAHFTPETSLGKLRLMCYPGAAASPALLAARNFGVSAHTDFEGHTFLHQDAPGLQLESRSGAWTESPVPDEAHFTVIMSDMMEVFSNGALRATRHRVLHVPWRRHALIRFVGFESLTQVAPLPELGPPRYQPVQQGEHLDRQVEEAEARRAASAAAGLIPAPVAVA